MKYNFFSLGWVLNLLIVFEILFMISPFALYYYSGYSHFLNIIGNSEYTYWLTSFFLPHFDESSVWVLNAAGEIGEWLFMAGLIMFVIAAAQIYYSKFTGRNAVTSGLYRLTRHPQYIAFVVMGVGLLMVWPRILVLAAYVTMLFAYYLLAKKEERDCSRKYGAAYDNYITEANRQSRINRILFGDYPRWGVILGYGVMLTVSILTVFGIRNWSLTTIPVVYTRNSATIAVLPMSDTNMNHILSITEQSEEIRMIKCDTTNYFLNYIIPAEWRLADLPMETYTDGEEGHILPEDISRKEFKVLYTKALIHSKDNMTEQDILKRTYGREPVVLFRVNIETNEIISVGQPPAHVLWGDIPTPIF